MSAILLAALLFAQDVAAPPASAEGETVAPPPVTDAPSLIAQIEGRLAAYGDLVAQMAARKARERYLSELLLPVIARDDLDEGAQGEILRALADDIRETEEDNSSWALRQIDPDSFAILWAENRRLGEDMLRMAQRDESGQRRQVAALEPVALAGEYDGAEFARMADALAVDDNRPQPYGTARTCEDGQTALWPVEDAATLNERRTALGLDPLDPAGVGGEACDSDTASPTE